MYPKIVNLFEKRAIYLFIFGAFLLIGLFYQYLSSGARTETVLTMKVVPLESVSTRRQSSPVIDFDSDAYYRPIIEYNLFRPLGWTPPRPIEPYRLVGTVFPRDTETPPQAIIEATGGGVSRIVSVGDALDSATTVAAIESKSVVLESSGVSRTLTIRGLVYLSGSRSVRDASPVSASPVRRVASERRSPSLRRSASVSPSNPPSAVGDLPYSDWETEDGERLPLGDARLKNPTKWGLRRR